MTRTPEAVARQRRGLIREAECFVRRVPDSRMAALGAPYGLDATATRSRWLADAVSRPRDVLIALAKETMR